MVNWIRGRNLIFDPIDGVQLDKFDDFERQNMYMNGIHSVRLCSTAISTLATLITHYSQVSSSWTEAVDEGRATVENVV
jgi:hypothetical protein